MTFFLILFIAISFGLGFWIGNLKNPAVSYRRKKVKKQSKDINLLNEQFKIQTAAMESLLLISKG